MTEAVRLRDALHQIAAITPPRGYEYWTDEHAADWLWHALGRCRRIARAALEPQP